MHFLLECPCAFLSEDKVVPFKPWIILNGFKRFKSYEEKTYDYIWIETLKRKAFKFVLYSGIS